MAKTGIQRLEEKEKTVQENRLETDANVFIDRAIAMMAECWRPPASAGYNGVLSLLQYAKESHAAKFKPLPEGYKTTSEIFEKHQYRTDLTIEQRYLGAMEEYGDQFRQPLPGDLKELINSEAEKTFPEFKGTHDENLWRAGATIIANFLEPKMAEQQRQIQGMRKDADLWIEREKELEKEIEELKSWKQSAISVIQKSRG